nr:chromosome condensation regulator RCC1 [Rugosimonospora africana]
MHSLALTSTGTVLAWGYNGGGQLGNGTNTNSNVPVPVDLPADTTVTAIAAGELHSLAVTSTGTVLAWGLNGDGQLGNGTNTSSNVPVLVDLPADTTVTAVSGGGEHSLALTSTGSVLAWGLNGAGQLGNGTNTSSNVPVPVDLPAGAAATAVAAGGVHSLALTSTGIVLAWGFNRSGQLGNGTNTSSNVPVAASLPAGATATAVAAGNGHSLALTSTGIVLAWGDNEFGQLGNGTNTNSNVPVPVGLPAGTTVTAIAAGELNSLAITPLPTAASALPVTGVSLPPALAAGLLFLLAGAGAVLVTHRRRPARRAA